MFVIHVPELSTLGKYTSCSIQFMVTHSHVVLKYIRPYIMHSTFQCWKMAKCKLVLDENVWSTLHSGGQMQIEWISNPCD